MNYTLESYNLAEKQDARGNHILYAKFAEDERTGIYWAVQKLPEIGARIDGEITMGEYGPRFKRTPPPAPAGVNPYAGANKGTSSRANAGNQEGQHQGMAINNAVQLIIKFAPAGLTIKQAIELIKPVAEGIYAIELGKTSSTAAQAPQTAPIASTGPAPQLTGDKPMPANFGLKDGDPRIVEDIADTPETQAEVDSSLDQVMTLFGMDGK